jgi:polysaccharide biosynthesis protein PslG
MRYFYPAVLCLICFLSVTRSVAAQPTCDPARFGVVEPLTWAFLYSQDTLDTSLAMMREAGIQWVRLNWSWKDFQPIEAPFDFSQFDLVAAAAQEHGIHLLPILTAVPAWASTAPADLIAERGNLSPVDRYRPRDINEWLTYIRTVVERYDGDGLEDAPGSPRFDYWEVWNEPNLSLFWPPQPDAAEYVELLRVTSEAVHEVDPTAQVVLGGLSGSGVNVEGTGYLQQVYQLGGAAYFDVVSIHLYMHPTLDVTRFQDALTGVRQVMDDNSDETVPIWLTEVGWSDTPDAWGQPTASPEEIASFLTDVYSAPLPVDKIFWYNFRNIFDNSPDVEHNFGLIYNDFTPKPAYEAYKAVAEACR